MILIILNGPAEVGKGTFAKILKKEYDISIIEYSSITTAKDILKYGWNWKGEKTPEVRSLCGKIKGLLIKYGNIPFHDVVKIARLAASEDVDFMITDVREPSEIEKLVDYFGFPTAKRTTKCLTIRITNTKKEKEAFKNLDIADNQYQLYAYDHIIENNGDLTDFKKNIVQVFNHYIKEKKNGN